MPDTPDPSDTATDERPPGACLLHRPPTDGWPWRPADPGYQTCGPCLDRLRIQLAEVRTRYQALDATPGSTGDGTRGAPGFRSKSPASDHVIALRDPRSSQTARMWRGADGKLHAEDEHPALSVWGELDTIAWAVAETLDMAGPDERSSVDDLLRWLDVRLDMATRTDLCVDLSATLRRLLAALRPVTGDPRPRKVGACPILLDTDTQTRCEAPLFAPVKGDTIRCRACGAQWERPDWEDLGRALTLTADTLDAAS